MAMMTAMLTRIAQAEQADRKDGYSRTTAAAVCAFQTWAEGQPNCDYSRLRTVLQKARGGEYSTAQLIALYNR
jgi:hypothetical protein